MALLRLLLRLLPTPPVGTLRGEAPVGLLSEEKPAGAVAGGLREVVLAMRLERVTSSCCLEALLVALLPEREEALPLALELALALPRIEKTLDTTAAVKGEEEEAVEVLG